MMNRYSDEINKVFDMALNIFLCVKYVQRYI